MHFKQNMTLMSTCLNLCDISVDPLFYRKSSVNHSNRSGSSSSSSNNSFDTRTRNSKSSKKFQRLKLENVLLGPVPVEIKKHSESFPGNFHSLSPDQVSMTPNIFVWHHWQKARSFLLSVNGLAFFGAVVIQFDDDEIDVPDLERVLRQRSRLLLHQIIE